MTGLYKKLSRTLVLASVVTAGIAFGGIVQQANASKGDLISIKEAKKVAPPLVITLGKADIISLPVGVSDVLVANPSIVDVQAVQSDKLYIVGLNIGDTNIIVLDASGNVVKRLDIHVSYDLQAIQSLVDSLFPKESVKVGAIHDQVLLTGRVSNPDVASKISNLVGHYVGDLQDAGGGAAADELIANLLEVQGEQQVMLQVKIIEAERNILKELGIDTVANDPNEASVTTIFGRTPSSSLTNHGNGGNFGGAAGLALSQDAIGAAGLVLDSGLNGIGKIGLFLSALEEQNLLSVLAEPNLTAVSGQKAGFLAGGEFPVPTGRDQFGNITVQFREFGVSLNFKPIVLSDDRINLQLDTEVSSLDSSNAVVLSGLTIPGLDIRRTNTTIEMPSGGSLMIAGLLQSQTAEGFKGLPGIKNTPVLGKLISSDSFQRNETELVVIVTATLVEPFADRKNSKRVPKENQTQLSKIFKANIRRMFDLGDDDVFANAGYYGYIID